jgi:hypothetical protein
MKYHLVTVLLIAAALPLCVLGFAMGGSLLLVAAMFFEVWFWARIIRGKSRLTRPNNGH